MSEVYRISSSEKIQLLEKDLASRLAELKTEIEENGILQGTPNKAYSSVPIPKDILYFRKEREMVLKKGLQVASTKPILIQAEVMQKELESCLRREYKVENIPLLLHQFYTDRIHHLVRSKYLYMLRWKRFCQHTDVMEQCYPMYQKQVGFIMKEYNDTVQRAQRLAVAREHFMTGQKKSVSLVTLEDLVIYTQWLVCHLHSVKNIHNYIRTLQYLPISDRAVPDTEPQSEELYVSDLGSVTSSSTVELAGLYESKEGTTLPTHQTEREQIKPLLRPLLSSFKIEYDTEKLRNTADEMELLSLVVTKFRSAFRKQQTMITFPVYDSGMEAIEGWGFSGPSMALKKKANWITFVKIKPKRDPWQQKCMARMKQHKKVDELLRLKSQFMKVSSADKVMEVLQEHAARVMDPAPVQALSARTIHEMWVKIYSPMDPLQDVNSGEGQQQTNDKCLDIANKRPASSRQKKETGYSYQNTLQLLGLDETEHKNSKDPVMMKGAYLSLLYLRHLKIRELQRTCLGFLNYFRSIQRTLTIDTCCLTSNAGSLVSCPGEEAFWVNAAQGGSGTPGGLGSHQYMHYTPADFKVHSAQFMEFSEVDNQNDYYTVEDGIVHTRDPRGAFIMYDVALEDLHELQEQLLLMTTHFIEGDKSFKSSKNESSDADLSEWAHVNVDRYAVLLDLWTWEAALLENKQQLVDSYYEAYQHVLDQEERFSLAQVITDIMFRRPRFDIGSKYFLKAYRDECQCLRLHQQIVTNVLNSQIESQREFVKKIWRDGQKGDVYEFGLPLNVISKTLISLNTSSPTLKNVYLLEFHPSLGLVYLVSKTLDHICQEFQHIFQAKTASHVARVEKHVLQMALDKWQAMHGPEFSYNANIRKDLFEELVIEDPIMVREICFTALESETDEEKKHGRGRPAFILEMFGKILELITLRHRLIETASETVVLSRSYKLFAEEMGFSEFHLYLRPVHFEFASIKGQAEQLPPLFITALLEDESSLDRYIPSTNLLAIHEVDDNQIGKFSFWSRDSILQLLGKFGVENIQVALACQVTQKNALLAAVQLASYCHLTQGSLQNIDPKGLFSNSLVPMTKRVAAPELFDQQQEVQMYLEAYWDGKALIQRRSSCTSERNLAPWTLVETQGSVTPMSNTNGVPPQCSWTKKRFPEAFVSIQLEKVGLRDTMLNMFIQKKQSMGTAMRNPEENERIKRELVMDYCRKISSRISSYSIRGQIIAYYNSLKHLLEQFPDIKDTYFIIGKPQDKKSGSKERIHGDPRIFQERTHNLLTEDGQMFLNLWYIPHQTELLVMFKILPEKTCIDALKYTLQIVASMHDIVSYMCSFAQLGNPCNGSSNKISKVLTADWGGTEGIGAELREIQKSIDSLPNPKSPKEVALFLLLRREVIFLQFDAAVRHLIREAFLSAGNISAFRTTTDNMFHGLPSLSSSVSSTAFSSQLPVPQPLDPCSHKTFLQFPWRMYLADGGLFPLAISGLGTTEYNMQLCLCGLTDQERSVAHGELVGVQLLMEDILQEKQDFISFTVEGEQEAKQMAPDIYSTTEENREPDRRTSLQLPNVPRNPIEMCRLLKSFLILWKQLEVFKEKWGKMKLRTEEINTVSLYKQFCELYRDEIFYPTMKAIARQMGQEEEFEGITLRSQIVLPPRGASELDVRIRQLEKILENFESHMILEVQKKVAKEMTLVISERAREESGLPTELWKQPFMKENFSPLRPQIVENFVQSLMKENHENDSKVTFSKEHLEKCLTSLACNIMARERSNFESFSMFYENLLRQEHQLLYQKEQEMLGIDADHRQIEANSNKTAEMSHELIVEITALRAKLAALQEESLTTKEAIRKEVQDEYETLVRTLFSTCINLKSRLDEYHINMNKEVCELISEVRKEGIDKMIVLKRKYGSKKDDTTLKNNLTLQDKLQSLRDENSHLHALVCKLKALNNWKVTIKEGQLRRKLRNAEKEAIQNKKEGLKLKLTVEQEVAQLRQQLMVSRTALSRTQAESINVKQQLDKQKQMLDESEHRHSQQTRSREQLDRIKSASMDRLLESMEEKEQRLRSLAEEAERASKMGQLQQSKRKKEVKQIKSQLTQERSLKLDAFQRVDELQTQVYDLEMMPSIRNSSAGQRKKSASVISRCARSATTASMSWTPVPNNFDQGTFRDYLPYYSSSEIKDEHVVKRIQRPKTVPSRCINRMASSLGAELTQSTSQTILTQLHELRLNTK
ncbi:uncharacterized protein O3C94_004746 [Discoglossus pictus]